MRLRDSTVALPRRWDCVSTELQHQETHERGMIKDKSAVSDPEIRYAFRQTVGMVNYGTHSCRAADVQYGTAGSSRPRVK
jgi:hypothetical protein